MLTGETYPSARALAYSYDEGGRLSSLSDGTTTFANSFAYAPQGGLTSETWGNTAVHTMAFNRRLQVSQMKLTVSSAVQQQYDYSYGQFNTSTGAVDTSKNNGQLGKIDATIGTTAQWNQGFSYDELGRLANVAEHQGNTISTQTYAQGYGYDRYGNRTQSANATLGLPSVSASDYDTSNNNNRFVSGVASYDAAGNVTSDAKFRSLTYTYDANGRQTSASNGSWTQTQVYDCAGQRVQTTVGSTTRTMVYDVFGQNVAEYSGGSLERENIYRGGALLATYEASTSALKYVLTDAQGSTRAIFNSSGAVTARHDYLPFGEEIAAGIGLRTSGQGFGATDTNRQEYGLTERDETSGLDHTWWRKYENQSGRWTSPDPVRGIINAPQSFNAYTYAANDPVNLIDPTGLDPQDPPPTTHIDPVTDQPVSVPGINAGVVTVTPEENSGLGMFGGDANQRVAVIDRALLNQGGGPQNPGQPAIDESGVRQNIANRLTNNCKQYITNLINEAARQNRNNPAVSTNLLDIFDAVKTQGGFHRLQVGTHQNPSYSHVLGTIPGKSATVYLAPLKLYPDMTAGEIARGALGLDSLGAFHELTHLSGSKEYDDMQLSRAARALGGPALPTAKTNKDLAFSTYLEAELKRNCPP